MNNGRKMSGLRSSQYRGRFDREQRSSLDRRGHHRFYAFGMIALGWYYGKRQKSTDEYFVGSRTMNPLLIGVSMFVTLSAPSPISHTQANYTERGLFFSPESSRYPSTTSLSATSWSLPTCAFG